MDSPMESAAKEPGAISPIAVVAVGGHAFMQSGETGTVDEHWHNAHLLCEKLLTLVHRGYNLVITHGNGPQVGNLLLQQERTSPEVPPMPLDVLVAQTEGSLGYILQQSLLNKLREQGIRRYVVTVITQVEVDAEDAAFQNPTKPIGPFLSEEVARARARDLGWQIKEDAGRGWRRLVPSPKPRKVIQHATIRDTVRQGHIVLAGGGGGIPIIREGEGEHFRGVEAVIDKDLTSSAIAQQLGADLLVILTATPCVYLNFGEPNQEPLGAVTLQELTRLRAEGHFPPGSMGPKVDGVAEFLLAGGRRALITDPDSLDGALEGAAGTHFIGRI